MTAPQAAGVIHSDFQKGFIRAETVSCDFQFACYDPSQLQFWMLHLLWNLNILSPTNYINIYHSFYNDCFPSLRYPTTILWRPVLLEQQGKKGW